MQSNEYECISVEPQEPALYLLLNLAYGEVVAAK